MVRMFVLIFCIFYFSCMKNFVEEIDLKTKIVNKMMDFYTNNEREMNLSLFEQELINLFFVHFDHFKDLIVSYKIDNQIKNSKNIIEILKYLFEEIQNKINNIIDTKNVLNESYEDVMNKSLKSIENLDYMESELDVCKRTIKEQEETIKEYETEIINNKNEFIKLYNEYKEMEDSKNYFEKFNENLTELYSKDLNKKMKKLK